MKIQGAPASSRAGVWRKLPARTRAHPGFSEESLRVTQIKLNLLPCGPLHLITDHRREAELTIKVQGRDARRRRGEIRAGVSQLAQAQTHGGKKRLREAAPLESGEDGHPMDAPSRFLGPLGAPPGRSRPD